MDKSEEQIILMFGPSGVGKSTLAKWITEDLNFLHINFDRWDGEGMDEKIIINEWNDFFQNLAAENLKKVIDENIKIQNKQGAVITFPSNVLPTIAHIRRAEKSGIRTVILYGPKEACMKAFLTREKAIGRNLGLDHWNKYNKLFYDGFSRSEFLPYTIDAFNNDDRRSRTSLIDDVKKK